MAKYDFLDVDGNMALSRFYETMGANQRMYVELCKEIEKSGSEQSAPINPTYGISTSTVDTAHLAKPSLKWEVDNKTAETASSYFELLECCDSEGNVLQVIDMIKDEGANKQDIAFRLIAMINRRCYELERKIVEETDERALEELELLWFDEKTKIDALTSLLGRDVDSYSIPEPQSKVNLILAMPNVKSPTFLNDLNNKDKSMYPMFSRLICLIETYGANPNVRTIKRLPHFKQMGIGCLYEAMNIETGGRVLFYQLDRENVLLASAFIKTCMGGERDYVAGMNRTASLCRQYRGDILPRLKDPDFIAQNQYNLEKMWRQLGGGEKPRKLEKVYEKGGGNK